MGMRQLVIAMLTIIVVGVAAAVAVASEMTGTLVHFKGGTLTLMDKKGSMESYHVDKDTLVMSRDGSNNRLEHTRVGTRISLTTRGGTAKTVVILEVPK